MALFILDALDQHILQLVANDARLPFLEISRQCNMSGATVHQRIQRLKKLGVITGSQYVIDPVAIGYGTCAFVGVCLTDHKDHQPLITALKDIPEVGSCHLTTGRYDMVVKIYARNNTHLLEIIQEKLQPVCPMRTETLISLREVFNRQVPMEFEEF
jgi:Lrp/AsnC family transcriptional regulator for asnA, asnC and gidA